MNDEFTLFHMAFTLIVVLDPLGNIPIFASLLKHFDAKKQREIIIRELLISLGLMIVFLFFGQGFFHFLNVKESSLQIAGGIILFLIAIRMVFSTPKYERVGQKIPKDPFIVPLAIPAIAGPAILATLTLFGGSGASKITVLGALLIAWALMVPTLLLSPYLKKLLGENGIVGVERLFGYLVVLIATNMAISGFLAAF